ncbi:MAG: sigma-70 family RNA polymerase sigma factor [Planctomycetes bacterium]|nr:sigma-70 family RNA polymerase sigma factor [Planctomycetota bacterium]
MSDWTPDVERLQRFDDQEWLAVERNYAGRLMAYVQRRVPDRAAREDVVQETFLGAVRGIHDFDPVFTFEQYLFGICKNRTIDWMRRQKAIVIQPRGEAEDMPILETLFQDDETPSGVARQNDLVRAGEDLLVRILREWVQETWQQGEFVRLMVIEALFSGEWRNRDTWERFQLRDETAVAGIKFRALKRLRELQRPRIRGATCSRCSPSRSTTARAAPKSASRSRGARGA